MIFARGPPVLTLAAWHSLMARGGKSRPTFRVFARRAENFALPDFELFNSIGLEASFPKTVSKICFCIGKTVARSQRVIRIIAHPLAFCDKR